VTSESVSPEFVAAYAELCRRIVSGDERPYDGALKLMGVIADPDELAKLPGSVYTMWGELTDACELRGEEACAHAEALMVEAASEFLRLADPATELPGWAESWIERIASDDALRE
jgi:hypothetical protein